MRQAIREIAWAGALMAGVAVLVLLAVGEFVVIGVSALTLFGLVLLALHATSVRRSDPLGWLAVAVGSLFAGAGAMAVFGACLYPPCAMVDSEFACRAMSASFCVLAVVFAVSSLLLALWSSVRMVTSLKRRWSRPK